MSKGPCSKFLDIKYEILDIWSKVLWCFSYLLCEINSQNEFITLNLSKFGAFLTIWSWIQIFEQCQKCSDCAHIWCDEFFWWVDFINKIWAQSEHFWQRPKFWTWNVKFWELSKMLRFFSYLLCKINWQKEFITFNLSKIGAFLTIWTSAQIFGHC